MKKVNYIFIILFLYLNKYYLVTLNILNLKKIILMKIYQETKKG